MRAGPGFGQSGETNQNSSSLDPLGNVVIGPTSVVDTPIFTTVAGRYTVLIEGRRNETSVINAKTSAMPSCVALRRSSSV